MTKRSTIDDDPHDLLIPPSPVAGAAVAQQKALRLAAQEIAAPAAAPASNAPRAPAVRPTQDGAAIEMRRSVRERHDAASRREAGGEKEVISYLTFALAEEEYAVPILQVREIIEYGGVTRVPTTPPYISGVINLRGSVVSVVNLTVKFGMAPRPVTRLTCIVIVEVQISCEPTVMGLVVDSVSQVIELGADEVEPPPVFGTKVRVDCLRGMGRLDKKLVLMLDLDRVMAADEALAAAATSAETQQAATDSTLE